MSTLERTLTLHPTVKVTLVWVPGHVGIAGNELADRTAVSGSTTSFLARRAGRLPGVPDQGGDVPVLLSRKVGSADDGAEDGEVGEEKTMPLDDSLTAREGSLFIARCVALLLSRASVKKADLRSACCPAQLPGGGDRQRSRGALWPVRQAVSRLWASSRALGRHR